jgi:hypothetical protein
VSDHDELPDRWTDAQVEIFVAVRDYMLANQHAMVHPATRLIPTREWATLCHNAAWVAAEKHAGVDIVIVDKDGDVVASEPGDIITFEPSGTLQ